MAATLASTITALLGSVTRRSSKALGRDWLWQLYASNDLALFRFATPANLSSRLLLADCGLPLDNSSEWRYIHRWPACSASRLARYFGRGGGNFVAERAK